MVPFFNRRESEECDVHIAERRDEESVMDTDRIRHLAFGQRDERAADNGRDQQARASSGQGAQALNAQSKDAGEHDGIEQSHREYRPHGNVTGRENRRGDEQTRDRGRNSQHQSCARLLQDGRADEAANHGAAPVEGNEPGCDLFRHVRDVRFVEILHKKTADRNLAANVGKNPYRRQDKLRVFDDGAEALIDIDFAGAEFLRIC